MAGWPEAWWTEESRSARDARWRQARLERRGRRPGADGDHDPWHLGERHDPRRPGQRDWGDDGFEPRLGDPYAADPPVREPPNPDPSDYDPPAYDPADLAPEWPIDARLVADAPPADPTPRGLRGLGRTRPEPVAGPPEPPPPPAAGDPPPGQAPSEAGRSRPRAATRGEREQWLRDYIDREQRFRLYFAKYIAGLLGRSSRSMRFWLWLIDDGRSQRREEAAYLKGTEEAGLIPALRARRAARRG